MKLSSLSYPYSEDYKAGCKCKLCKETKKRWNDAYKAKHGEEVRRRRRELREIKKQLLNCA